MMATNLLMTQYWFALQALWRSDFDFFIVEDLRASSPLHCCIVLVSRDLTNDVCLVSFILLYYYFVLFSKTWPPKAAI